MISIVLVNAHADYGRDFHPPANHLTQLRNFTKGEFVLIFYSFSSFSPQLMIHQIFSNKQNTYTNCANELEWDCGC